MSNSRPWAFCLLFVGVWLTGCNPEDVKSLESDTKRLGRDIGPSVGNTALAAKVSTHLTLHKGIDMSGLHIVASGSTITASGHVRDAGMRKKVLNTIQETPGVDHVKDELRLER